MDIALNFIETLVTQLQKPTLAFLIAGAALAAFGSRFEIPAPVYKFIVALLLLKVGMNAGISIRGADWVTLLVPAVGAVVLGVVIVLLGSTLLSRARGVSKVDGFATAGLFGAVSASTLAAGMAMLDDEGIAYEGFIGALYPFMDMAALVTAIVLARLSAARAKVAPDASGTATMSGPPIGTAWSDGVDMFKEILSDTLRSPAISALIAGLALGLLSRPESVFDSFYEPLFRGLLSLLMLIMGMEAWSRLSEMRKVAHVYVLYGISAPIVHGLLGFGVGLAAHHLTGFSEGGVILLAVMAASSSDISGPPTIRAALPEANVSAYVGTSTGLGTPVAILSIPLFMALAEIAI
ncbi:MAG: sodium-dependent bicarbonate transport family permease [Pseudomonadota bacterium]